MGSRKAADGRGGRWRRRVKIAAAVAFVALIGWGYGYFPRLLANIYDPTDGSGDADSAVPARIRLLGAEGLPDWPDAMEVHRRYNDAIAACARGHPSVHLVDIHSAFLGHGIHCRKFWRRTYRRDDPYFWYMTFLEDPNPRGQDAIRRLFLLQMAAVLGSGAKGDG